MVKKAEKFVHIFVHMCLFLSRQNEKKRKTTTEKAHINAF